MINNEMKLIGVVIMVMLVIGFAKANFNSAFKQIGSNHVSSKPRLTCGTLVRRLDGKDIQNRKL